MNSTAIPIRIQIFTFSYVSSEDSMQAINNWLEQNKDITIVNIAQSEAGAENGYSLTISIWYYD